MTGGLRRHLVLLFALALAPGRAQAGDVEPVQVTIETRFVQVQFEDLREVGFHRDARETTFTVPSADPELTDLPMVGRLMRGERGNVLAAPRLLTTSREPAEIFVGGDVDFDGVVYPQVGIRLRVTPTVREGDDSLTLEVQVDVDQFVDTLPLPTVSSRTAGTSVLLRDRATLMIGGLYRDETREAASKLPLLSEIPILGRLFARRGFHDRREELFIFVTPVLVGEGGSRVGGRPPTGTRRSPQIDRPQVDPNLRGPRTPRYPSGKKSGSYPVR